MEPQTSYIVPETMISLVKKAVLNARIQNKPLKYLELSVGAYTQLLGEIKDDARWASACNESKFMGVTIVLEGEIQRLAE